MIKLGITGGIGSGKTTVCKLLNHLYNIPIYYSDEKAQELIKSSTEIKEGLISMFGSKIYHEGGLNRKLLATYLFSDRTCLDNVNKLIHPIVAKDFEKWCSYNISKLIVAKESAILFESKHNMLVDKTIMVYTPIEMRIERVMKRNNITREDVIARIENQMKDEEKLTLCDYIIINDGVQKLDEQIKNIVNDIA